MAFQRVSRRACVRNALALARSHGYASVAFPLIGAGTGGLKEERVREVMLEEISSADYDGRVVVVTFGR